MNEFPGGISDIITQITSDFSNGKQLIDSNGLNSGDVGSDLMISDQIEDNNWNQVCEEMAIVWNIAILKVSIHYPLSLSLLSLVIFVHFSCWFFVCILCLFFYFVLYLSLSPRHHYLFWPKCHFNPVSPDPRYSSTRCFKSLIPLSLPHACYISIFLQVGHLYIFQKTTTDLYLYYWIIFCINQCASIFTTVYPPWTFCIDATLYFSTLLVAQPGITPLSLSLYNLYFVLNLLQ